jgi:hypothetical protein
MNKKNMILLTISFFLSYSVFGQDALKKRMNEVRQLIQRSIPLDATQYSNTNEEYFLIDLSIIPHTAAIKTATIYCKDSSAHISFVRNTLAEIERTWKPIKTYYNRILIPVIIIISGKDDKDDYLNELPVCLSKEQAKKTYLFKQVICMPVFPMR